MPQTTLSSKAALILDKSAIERKMLRMAYEIYERNADRKEIILAGITEKGTTIAHALKEKITAIASFKITILKIQIDKRNPLDAQLENNTDCTDKVVIVTDDVANSGRTLFYGMRPFLDMLPLEIETAVLVDRMHKNFPVLVDYTGYRLSTTLQEKVIVDISDKDIKGVYLD